MRQIPLSASLLVFLEDIEFTEAALSAHEETRDLARPFQEEIEGWERVFKSFREARRAIVRADAAVSVANQTLDETTTRFGHTVLAEAGGDRKSTLFRRFFPSPPSEFIRENLRRQCERTRDGIVVELGKLADTSPLKAFIAPLNSQLNCALDALDTRAKVHAERGSTAYDIEEWKEGINRLRLSTYGALLNIAGEKGLGKGFANSFFRNPSDRKEQATSSLSEAT